MLTCSYFWNHCEWNCIFKTWFFLSIFRSMDIFTWLFWILLWLLLLHFTVPTNGDNYTYTSGIDAEDIFLFCNTEDSSVQLYNINWRRKDGLSYHSNPLDVYTLRNILMLTNSREMECFDTESGDLIMSVKLYIQGLLFSLEVLYGIIIRLFVHDLLA